MAFKKGKPKTGGRQKGQSNGFTRSAREAFQAAFIGMGGIPKLIEWGKNNPGDFYKLYSKLIPVGVFISQSTEVNTHKET